MNVLLLDGTGLAYRSYFAFVRNPLRTASGEETSLVFAFVNTLLRMLERYAPGRAAVVFDPPGPTFRHDIDSHYKEGRPPMPEGMAKQLPRLRQTLEAFKLPMLQVAGFEADDVMGTLARRFEREDADVYLVTGDKDFQQLLSRRIRIVRLLRSGGESEVGPAELQTELGIAPRQVVDYMALCGDSVDNIRGVPGVGAKTAQALIRDHGSLDSIYKNLETIRGAVRRKLEEGRENAMLARELLRIVTDVPLELEEQALSWTQPDWPRLRSILRELEFFQLLRSLPSESIAVAQPQLEVIGSVESLERVVTALREREVVALHVEPTRDEAGSPAVFGIAIAADAARSWVVPLAAPSPQLQLGELALEATPTLALGLELVGEHLAPLLDDAGVVKVGHDLKTLLHRLEPAGITRLQRGFDTMVAAYVLNPARRSHAPEALLSELLDQRLRSTAELFDPKERARDLRSLPRDEIMRHLGQHATAVWGLHQPLREQLAAERLVPLFDDIEMPLVDVLFDMERVGVKVDVALLGELSQELEARTDALAEQIYALAGRRFNIQSPRQLGEVLFDELRLPHGRRTKTGWSTDSDVLERLQSEHELPRCVLEFRQLAKLRSTWTEALPRLVRARSGRIHTHFNQTVASTGRLSSSDPNLQNIPIRTELGRRIRTAFVADGADVRLLSADYSQIELRIMAHLSQDRGLMQAFRDGGDVHTLTAARIAGRAPAEVTSPERAAAKTVNFGVIYGMGARGLSQQLGIALDEARHFIDEYFATYPGVRRYTQDAIQQARTQGFVTTLLGRRLVLPDLQSGHPGQRAAAERVAVNAPIQGSAADLIKTAMVRVHRRLRQREMRARMILQVHDELLFEAPQAELELLADIVRVEMEGAMQLSVPIVVDVGVGRDWAEAH
ncbi:MAG: DNA polymerase I [Candidatus Latescibacterota bacterium]|nr:MAG: DNA polymerase I [Candidatus Latescibacterota bacterium]